ncbi:hypothetical protein CGMCC3_g7825 [Colletotrichum fructicola]|nr:uncharacterized protein CGMCC3_g7825 [Colletotrichum fructicola]KAE9576293.1 hypothetical protein CGMCC3_g7825 [Colletotrichum fructicola]
MPAACTLPTYPPTPVYVRIEQNLVLAHHEATV